MVLIGPDIKNSWDTLMSSSLSEEEELGRNGYGSEATKCQTSS